MQHVQVCKILNYSMKVLTFRILEPKWRIVNEFSGTITDPSKILYEEFTSEYGSANDTRVTIDFDKGSYNISSLNVTYCLQRKLFVCIS